MNGTIDPVELFKLIGAIIAFCTSFLQLISMHYSRYRWKQKADSQVGNLGATYFCIITAPSLLSIIVVVGLMLWFLWFLVALGGQLTQLPSWQQVPQILRWSIDNIVVAFIIYGIYVLQNQYNALPESVRWIIPMIRRDWSYSINIDKVRCKQLADQVFQHIRREQSPNPGEHRDLQDITLTESEKANFILFLAAIERQTVHLYPRNRSILPQMWDAILTLAQSSEHPLSPATLKTYVQEGKILYTELRTRSEPDESPLPESAIISDTIQKVMERLVKSYDGDALKLAKVKAVVPIVKQPIVFGKPTIPGLDLGLQTFEIFQGDEAEQYRTVYLKVASRNNIEPIPSYFPYPYSTNVARLLLNSGCLPAAAKVDVIEADVHFRRLVAVAEDNVIRQVHEMIRESATDQATRTLCKTVFNSDPLSLEYMRIAHYLDVWLWHHSNTFCAKIDRDHSGQTVGCNLLQHGRCLCDDTASPWILDSRVLRRD